MDDEFIFPAADLYRPVYDHAPPNDPSKSILSLPTEVIVNIAQLNYKTAIALMCTNRVLHAAGITALYARVYLKGWMFKRFNPDAPNFIVPGVLGSLLAKREHTAALRYLKILSMPYDTNHWTEFRTLIYRVFERAHGLVHVDLRAIYGFQHAPSPGHNSLQQIYPQNLHTLHLRSPTDHFAPPLLTAPSLKEVQISGSLWRWDTFPERKQGAYSQLTSWSYDDQEVEVDTPVDDFLKMVTPFGSVERLEVKVDQLSEVSREVFNSVERELTPAPCSFSIVSHNGGQGSNICP